MTFAEFTAQSVAKAMDDASPSTAEEEEERGAPLPPSGVRPGATVAPIGWPITGCGILVLHPDTLEELPPFAPTAAADSEVTVGEIFVFGAHLAEGYLNRPDLNAHSFPTLRKKVQNHHGDDDDGMGGTTHTGGLARYEVVASGEEVSSCEKGRTLRCFRTGDFGFHLASDGALCYVGRRDQQVRN